MDRRFGARLGGAECGGHDRSWPAGDEKDARGCSQGRLSASLRFRTEEFGYDELMPALPASSPPAHDQRDQFLRLLSKSIDEGTFARLVLARYHGPEPELSKVIARQLTVRGEACLSFVYRYKTRDVTKNVPIAEAIPAIAEVLGSAFENAHLLTSTQDIQLALSRKGKYSLRTGRVDPGVDPTTP